MAGRAIWSGVISFGMVHIPVKLFGATHSKDLSFNLIHTSCGTKLQQKRWCPTDEVEVPWSEVARGYQYAKGEYVTLTDEDFEQLPLPSKHTIELTAFVERVEIDPVFYEKSYFLTPDASAEKAYALLLTSLDEEGLTALATITIRKKEQLCALRPHGGTLMLETLFYPDEVQLEREVDLSKVKLAERELQMARALIEVLRKPFRPEDYQDHYREALGTLIEAKLDGKQVVTSPPPRDTKVINLADALARSIAVARKSGKQTTRKAAAHAATKPSPADGKPRRAARAPEKAPARSARRATRKVG